MTKQVERAGELDFWKLIFSLLIVVHHSKYLPIDITRSLFIGGSIGVEFFFLVSGFLLLRSADKKREALTDPDYFAETAAFIKRKVAVFFPYMLFAFAVSLVFKTIAEGGTFATLIKNGGSGLTELLLVNWSGVDPLRVNGPTWYLSAMVLSMLILYPLLLRFGKTFSRLVCPLMALFLLGYLYQNYHQFRTPDAWDGFFYKGMIRAFAEISLGVFCAEICEWLGRARLTKLSKVLLSVLEYGALIGIILYANREQWWDMDVPSLLLMSAAVVIAGGNFSVTSGFWNRLKVTSKLSKAALLLYLNHFYWIWIFQIIGLRIRYQEMLPLYLACAIASSAVCWIAVDGVRALIRKNSAKIRKVFVEE